MAASKIAAPMVEGARSWPPWHWHGRAGEGVEFEALIEFTTKGGGETMAMQTSGVSWSVPR